jgi:hypothetical protein
LAKFVSPGASLMQSMNGETLVFMAPEIIAREANDYDFSVDVYAFGFIVFLLITKLETDPGLGHPMRAMPYVATGGRPKIPADVLRPYATLMERCGHHHPDKPPDFLAVVQILTIDTCLTAAGMSDDAVWHYHRRVCPPPAAPARGAVARDASATVPATAAVADLRAMANAGDVRSQVAFGWWLERGDGITKDAAEGVRYFRLAADRGDAIVLWRLGTHALRFRSCTGCSGGG